MDETKVNVIIGLVFGILITVLSLLTDAGLPGIVFGGLWTIGFIILAIKVFFTK